MECVYIVESDTESLFSSFSLSLAGSVSFLCSFDTSSQMFGRFIVSARRQFLTHRRFLSTVHNTVFILFDEVFFVCQRYNITIRSVYFVSESEILVYSLVFWLVLLFYRYFSFSLFRSGVRFAGIFQRFLLWCINCVFFSSSFEWVCSFCGCVQCLFNCTIVNLVCKWEKGGKSALLFKNITIRRLMLTVLQGFFFHYFHRWTEPA